MRGKKGKKQQKGAKRGEQDAKSSSNAKKIINVATGIYKHKLGVIQKENEHCVCKYVFYVLQNITHTL